MPKLKLQTIHIKEFITFSVDIQSDKSDIQPILKYIKAEISFGECTLTKFNNYGFCIYTFDTDQDDIEFVIPEKELIDFCSVTNEPFIYLDISEDSNTHTIKDKDIKKCYSVQYNDRGYKLKDFPTIPVDHKIEGSAIRLNKDVLFAIQRARPYSGSDELLPQFCSIYIEDKFIYAYGGQSCFLWEGSSTLPKLALSKREVQVLSKFDYIDYLYQEGINWNIFKNESVIYGFLQNAQATGFDYKRFLTFSDRTKPSFKIRTDELVRFCTSVKNYTNSGDKVRESAKWKNSSLNLREGTCELSFDVKENGEGINLSCDCSGSANLGKVNFNFNQTQCSEIFKSLPYEEISLIDNGNMITMFNEDDLSYTGFFMKVMAS